MPTILATLTSYPERRFIQNWTKYRFVWLLIGIFIYGHNNVFLVKIHHEFQHFSWPDAWYSHVHLDIIGPLPPSNNPALVVMAMERFTKWPVALFLRYIYSRSIHKVFFENYNVHSNIIINQVLFLRLTCWNSY